MLWKKALTILILIIFTDINIFNYFIYIFALK
jgi:hypothetical protein